MRRNPGGISTRKEDKMFWCPETVANCHIDGIHSSVEIPVGSCVDFSAGTSLFLRVQIPADFQHAMGDLLVVIFHIFLC